MSSGLPLYERYARAVLMTGPMRVGRRPRITIDGYWLDNSTYFYAKQRVAQETPDRLITVPTVFDCTTQSQREVMEPSRLAEVLTKHAGHPVALAALATAHFEMPNPSTLTVSMRGSHYLVNLRDYEVISERRSLERPALYSPDGRYACFAQSSNLCVRNLTAGTDLPLTSDGTAENPYGLQGVSLAEVSCPARPLCGLWSPDSRWFLTHRIDRTGVSSLPLVQHVPGEARRPALHSFPYPMPGDPIPTGVFVIVQIETGRIFTFQDQPFPAPVFSPFSYQLAWFGKERVWFVRLDRYCRRAELVVLDLRTQSSRVVLTESVPDGYLAISSPESPPNVRVLEDSNEVIWYSERADWGHLYLYDDSGRVKNAITSGPWQVRNIVHVDEKARTVFYLASGSRPNGDPARRVLCMSRLDGHGFQVLFEGDGDIHVPTTAPGAADQSRPFRPATAWPGISPDSRFAVVRTGNLRTGNKIEAVELQARRRVELFCVQPDIDEGPTRQFEAVAADGTTRLYGALFLPPQFDEQKRYPLIDYIYPGPHVAHQPQCYGSAHAALAQAMAQLGFVVLMLDTRGTPGRNRGFTQAGYGNLLEPQLADHTAVVRQLCDRHLFIARDRVGTLGHSAGGAAAARLLFQYPDTFKVAVAVCGNHDSSAYASFFSDSYRGPPDPGKFAHQANSSAAALLRGKLMLVYGDLDDNVHPAHTLTLANALIRANRDFDLVVVPNAGHWILLTCGYALRRIFDYFVTHLLGETPPRDFLVEYDPERLALFIERYIQEARK